MTIPVDSDGNGARAARRRWRLLGELAVRASVAVLVIVFVTVFDPGHDHRKGATIRALALLVLALNGPYYLAARTGWRLRAQAYARMLVDIGFITAGLASVGGLTAAPYAGIYAVVSVYAGLVLSSRACLAATGTATAAYLALALAQRGNGPLFADAQRHWAVAAFNLLIVNLVGALTAILAEAYRQSRVRLAAANAELERANDQSMRLNVEIQRAARLRALGEVVAGITHELGNVLSVAFGHVSLLRRKSRVLPGELESHLTQIEQSLDSALRIIRHSLDTARSAETERTAVSVAESVRGIIELKGYELRRDGIVIRVRFPEGFPLVLATPFQLQQVLLNLVTNAQHALRERPGPREIEIVGLAPGRRAILEVRDTGPGIPDELLPRLFEPFVTTKADGTGLGLAISAGIVRELGGQLSAANRPQGGAVFRVSLPAFDCSDAPPPQPVHDIADARSERSAPR